MKKHLRRFIISIPFFIWTGLSYADTVQLSITGDILAVGCKVDSISQNMNITLPDVHIDALKSVGNTAGDTPVNIKFVDCPTGVDFTIAMTFSGRTVTGVANNSVLQNNGTAEGVGVQLLGAASSSPVADTPVSINGPGLNYETNGRSTRILPFSVRYYRTDTALKSGDITATVTANVTYN